MKPEERERQLVLVAQSMFIERGYQGTAMEDIAQAAGITRPVIYKLFGHKDGIYMACLRQARELLNDYILKAAMAGNGLEQRLQGGIQGYFDFVENEQSAWRFLYDSGVAVAGDAAQEATRMRFDTVNRIAALLADLKPRFTDEEVLALAHALSGAGEQMAKWWVTQPHVPKRVIVSTLYNMSLHWRIANSTP